MGNPVQVTTGQKAWTETDFGKPFEFRRYYTSRPSNNFLRSGLGGQWRHTYDRRLLLTDSPTQLWALRADSTIVLFTSDGTGHWNPSSGSSLRLTTQGSGFLLRSDQDDQETYDATGLLTNIQTRDGRQFMLAYDPNSGLLTSVADDQGRSLTFAVASNGYGARFQSITDSAGGQLQFQYSPVNELSGVTWTDIGGVVRQRTYAYELSAQPTLLTGITDETGQRYSTYSYDTSNRVQSSTLWGDATHQVNTFGFSYPSSTTTHVTTPLGATTFTYALIAGAQRLTGSSQPCASCGSEAQVKHYDNAGYPTDATDFNGNLTTYTYDDLRGLETQHVDASNDTSTPSSKRAIVTTWHPTFRVPTERRTLNASNGLEAKTDWVYNNRGQATARCEIDPGDTAAMAYTCSATTAPLVGVKVRRWVTTYCEQADVSAGTCPLVGLVTSVNGPRPAGDTGMAAGQDDVATYTYYPTDDSTCASNGACPHRHGDLWKVTNALGQITTTVSYDKNGRVTRTQDANGTTTDFTYHPRGWLLTRTVRANADGSANTTQDATTTIAYDAVGNVTKVTQSDGDYLAYTYDAAHRLIKITDALSNVIDYCPGGVGTATCLDAAGNRLVEQVKDPSGAIKRSLSRTYNTLSRLTQVANAANAPTVSYPASGGYDGNGNPTLSTDGLGYQTQQAYDGFNRLKATIQNVGGADTATKNTETDYAYDTRDNLRSVKDPDLIATTYDYDGLNNLTGLHSHDTGDTGYHSDAAGNRISQTDNRGVTSTYTYDALNRLTAIS
ncbi:DUF6531 domain-containing protein, partial [Dokdonella soli]